MDFARFFDACVDVAIACACVFFAVLVLAALTGAF